MATAAGSTASVSTAAINMVTIFRAIELPIRMAAKYARASPVSTVVSDAGKSLTGYSFLVRA